MTQTVRSQATARADREPIDDLDGGLAVSPADIGERLWHFFISMRTGLALILALAVLGLVGTLLVQAPAGPEERPAGLRHVARVAPPEVRRLDRHPRHPRPVLDLQLGLVPGDHGPAHDERPRLLGEPGPASLEADGPPPDEHEPDVLIRARTPERAGRRGPSSRGRRPASRPAFRRRHFRTIVNGDGDTIHLYADRFRWGPFGTVIAHLSLVLILIGALVGSSLGFRNNGLAVAGRVAGRRRVRHRPVGRGEELHRLLLHERQPERLRQRPRPVQGRPAGRRRQTIRVNQPLARGRRDLLPVLLRRGGRDAGG